MHVQPPRLHFGEESRVGGAHGCRVLNGPRRDPDEPSPELARASARRSQPCHLGQALSQARLRLRLPILVQLDGKRGPLRGSEVTALKRGAEHVLEVVDGADRADGDALEAEFARGAQPLAPVQDDAGRVDLERDDDPALAYVGEKARPLLPRHLGHEAGLLVEA
jgi:hypothetical protein